MSYSPNIQDEVYERHTRWIASSEAAYDLMKILSFLGVNIRWEGDDVYYYWWDSLVDKYVMPTMVDLNPTQAGRGLRKPRGK